MADFFGAYGFLWNGFSGLIDPGMTWMVLGGLAVFTLLAGFHGAPFIAWTVIIAGSLIGLAAPTWMIWGFIGFAVIFNLRPLRKVVLSAPMMSLMKALKIVPKISPTERAALDAGVVWVESEFFSGKPNFKKMLKEPYPELTKEERAYLDGPVNEICAAIDDWQIWQEKKISEPVMNLMRKHKIFGMIIPKKYGGLEFSALAHSAVIEKIASRSVAATVTAMVPNSLGPAELLNHFGTQAQKDHYLPKLATGELIPCFALTEPRAGSDAGSIQAEGTLFKGDDGILYIRLNWNKRWITLAAISQVLGLAFRLNDPENFLGKGEYLGITCALIPSETPGVVIGRRHDPLGCPFYNCPTQGKDVVVPAAEVIIGGLEGAGKGWGMLMDSLGAGRGISLPAQSTGGSKLVARVTSAHSIIRKQFGLNIGKFEGVEEPLARIGGFTYILEAMKRVTLGALDNGIAPPVITAIAKYNSTELGRIIVNDGMDVMGGTGISKGPRNLIANLYICTPIGITVEGANILTRTLMIFGQGLLRAHPWAYEEVRALEEKNLNKFDRAIWGHVGHIFQNIFRSILLSLSRGRLASSPVGGPTAKYYKKLAWASASFALMSDIAMGGLGGALKLKEKLTGRFADILSWQYMSYAVLRRWEAEGRRKEDLPFVHFSLKYGLAKIQHGFDGIFGNIPIPGMSWLFNGPFYWWSRLNAIQGDMSDEIGKQVATILLTDSEQRDRLTDGIYLPENPNDALGRVERAFRVICGSDQAEVKVRKAMRKRLLPKSRVYLVIDEALEKGVISQKEYEDLKDSAAARWDAIQVDDFSEEEYQGRRIQAVSGDSMTSSSSSSNPNPVKMSAKS